MSVWLIYCKIKMAIILYDKDGFNTVQECKYGYYTVRERWLLYCTGMSAWLLYCKIKMARLGFYIE
jgi:hypothetical protein